MSRTRPAFSAFGIPVTIDPWFLIALWIFYSLSGGGRGGIFTAVAIGVFTLVHEFGHALCARSFGAVAEIRLSFLVGWAEYSASKPLARWQRNLISLMGPLAQFVFAAVALGIVREGLLPATDRSTVELYVDLYDAIAWAGITLAVLNLLPLWPLDGGHLAESAVTALFGRPARRAFLVVTLGACGVMFLFSFSRGALGSDLEKWATDQRVLAALAPLPEAIGRLTIAVPAIALTSTIFIPLFCALSSWQALKFEQAPGVVVTGASRVDLTALATEEVLRAVRTAERHGWETGHVGEFPRGFVASPWLEAQLARRAGAAHEQVSTVLVRLADDGSRWSLDRIERPEIGELLMFVPETIATCAHVAEARVMHGTTQALIDSALAAYHGDAAAEGFYLVAEGLTVRGDFDTAMQWLTSAVERRPDPRRVATSPRFRPLHGRHDFQQLLGVAERSGGG